MTATLPQPDAAPEESAEARRTRIAAERVALDRAYAEVRSGGGLELEAFNAWFDDLISKIPD